MNENEHLEFTLETSSVPLKSSFFYSKILEDFIFVAKCQKKALKFLNLIFKNIFFPQLLQKSK